MFVRLTTGRDAGDVVEMKYLDAKALLDDGRARRLEDPEVKVEKTAARVSAAEVSVTPKKKKR